MSLSVSVEFNKYGIEERINLGVCRISLRQISSITEFEESWSARIIMTSGQSYLVDGASDVLFDGRAALKSQEPPAESDRNDIVTLRLIREEFQPKSWLGRLFSDAVMVFKGNGDPLPPLRVTHQNGRKLSKAELREIYGADGSIRNEP